MKTERGLCIQTTVVFFIGSKLVYEIAVSSGHNLSLWKGMESASSDLVIKVLDTL